MRVWRGMMLVCGMVAGCGAAIEEEPRPAGTAEAREGAACEWLPEVGEAQRVKSILPRTIYFSRLAEMPESLVEFRDRLFFAVNFEDRRTSLWSSDGTEEGTVQVKEFPAAFSFDFWGRVNSLTPAGEQLFFLATEAATGQELWVTDGTPGGTRLVEDLTLGPDSTSPGNLTGLGSRLVFFRGSELWHSDGTAAGTERLMDLGAGASVSFQTLQPDDTLLFFVSSASRGTELWTTDGTASGTGRVRSLDAGEVFVQDVRLAGRLGFFTLIDEDNSTEVWKTDGTPGGTVRLRTFGPTMSTRLLGGLGSSVYVALTDYSELRMSIYRLRTDGSGVREYVTTLPNPDADDPSAFPFLDAVSAAEERIYFSIGISTPGPAPRDTQLWVTDGTKAGTRLLRRPLSLSDEYGSPLYAVSGRLAFFSSFEEEGAGIEPWVTDGTVGGTRRLRDVAPDRESSYPREFLRVGDRVFFNAFDDTHAGQLWSAPLRNACHAEEGAQPPGWLRVGELEAQACESHFGRGP